MGEPKFKVGDILKNSYKGAELYRYHITDIANESYLFTTYYDGRIIGKYSRKILELEAESRISKLTKLDKALE